MRVFVGVLASALLLLVAAIGIGLIWSQTPTARASWHTEGVYSGYFVSGFERSTFVPVGSNERWYLTGRAAGRTDINTGDRMYIEVRATLSEEGNHGHMGGYRRALKASELLSARRMLPSESAAALY